MEVSISIAIPAYCDSARLERCLKSIRRVDPNWLALVVVTDDSGDGRVAKALSEKYPEVAWIVNDSNRGFAYSANAAVLACRTEWVLLLNDDSEAYDDPRVPLVSLLGSESLFAISLRSTNERGDTREGAKRLVWRFGIAKILHNEQDQDHLVNGVSNTAYAVGGHALFNQDAFRRLGGFDLLFHPFYWEDVDICARASAQGLRTVYCQKASVIHREDGAIKSSNNSATIHYATWLNRLLFSHRHARGLQRILLGFGLVWHRIYAFMDQDQPRRKAIDEFTKRTSLHKSSKK